MKNICSIITDINECELAIHGCETKNAICKNTFGSYECICKIGLVMYDGTCQDTNECVPGVRMCDSDSQVCVNSVGSYNCKCRTGFIQSSNPYLCYG